ncbi:MAG: GNAT family N-acetyltransferase [Saprospiraceae bacterium]|nr:GNAT family N-acetyltransferase [Saprospiraceae bacterium]
MPYVFTSDRIGFREWEDTDLEPMSVLNGDKVVMQYFPGTQTLNQTQALIERMRSQYDKNGFCYFAVDFLDTNEFMGCIGCAEQFFESPYTPCIDIGWRLNKAFWHKGLATEGARACLDFMKNEHEIAKIMSFAPEINHPSIAVMKKIGMQYIGSFNHPALKDVPLLESCVAYST